VPQVLVTVYIAVSIPALTPVTMPPDIVALPLLTLHAPPADASVSVTEESVQILEACPI